MNESNSKSAEITEAKTETIGMFRKIVRRFLPSLLEGPETLKVETIKFLGQDLELIPEHAEILRAIDEDTIFQLTVKNGEIIAINMYPFEGWRGKRLENNLNHRE